MQEKEEEEKEIECEERWAHTDKFSFLAHCNKCLCSCSGYKSVSLMISGTAIDGALKQGD